MKTYMPKTIALMTLAAQFIILAGCAKKEPKTIICIGDSLTTCGGADGRYTDYLAKWLPRHKIINKGVDGDTLAGGRARFQKDVIDLKPDIVVIELGANDFWRRERPVTELRADLEDMVIRAKAIGAEVVIASCFGNRTFNTEQNVEFSQDRFDFADAIAQMETEIAKKHACFYVPNMQVDIKPNGTMPYWEDNNHPNALGNRFVAKRILKELKKALRKNAKKTASSP